MWKIPRKARAVLIGIAAIAAMKADASAQNTFINQNISGFNLPGVQLPTGHDEVRAADGTTCRSSVSGSGAYLDVGVIGNPEQDSDTHGSFSAYGRVVVPLGKRPQRLDCSRIYDLEVERMAMELKLMQMGLNGGIAPVSAGVETTSDGWSTSEYDPDGADRQGRQGVKAEGSNWVEDGWSTEGLRE